MTLYSRRQLVLLLGLVVAGGLGMAIGEWRRANPELAAAIEASDRVEDEATARAPARAVPSPSPPAPARPIREAPAPGPLDINRATAAELTRLPGIGPVLAARIVAARDSQGPFASVDDLRRVSGVGPAKLAVFRDQLVVAP